MSQVRRPSLEEHLAESSNSVHWQDFTGNLGFHNNLISYENCEHWILIYIDHTHQKETPADNVMHGRSLIVTNCFEIKFWIGIPSDP